MSVLTLAVFSDSPEYVNRFLAFFRANRSDLFETIGFTDISALNNFLSAGRIDILLLSRENIHDLYTCANFSNGKEDNSIDNSDVVRELILLGERQNLSSTPKEINMYRSMPEISRDIERIASSMLPEGSSVKSDAEILGIFNLDGDTDPYAVAMNLKPASGRTLFMDLDRFSPLPFSIGPSHSHEISNLLFLYKMESREFPSFIRDCIYERDGLDIMTVPVSPFDLDEIRSFEWTDFFSAIAAAGHYSCLIVNMADSARDLFGLFSACREVFVITDHFQEITSSSDVSEHMSFSAKRAAAFGQYFTENNFSSLLSKLKKAVPQEISSQLPPQRRSLFRKKASNE